jgi:tetratricopeptide (TPR) repeat protein
MLAWLLVYDWDWSGSQAELRRAVELGPNLPGVHYAYGHWYLTKEFPEQATAEAELALELNPLSVMLSYHLGGVHYFCRHYDQAIDQLQKAIELDPSFVPTHQLLALAYARSGCLKMLRRRLRRGLRCLGEIFVQKDSWQWLMD